MCADPLLAGNYAVVIMADAHATDVIGGMLVATGVNTQISASEAPIAMQTSAANNDVSGKVAPEAAQVTISAIQTLGVGNYSDHQICERRCGQ